MTDMNGSAANVTRERLDHIEAAHVSVGRSGVRMVDADKATLEHAAVQRLRATQAHIDRSNIGVATFEHGSITRGNAGIVVGQSVACDEMRTLVLASPVVRGEVHTLIDLRTAVAIGFGMALGKGLLSLLTRSR